MTPGVSSFHSNRYMGKHPDLLFLKIVPNLPLYDTLFERNDSLTIKLLSLLGFACSVVTKKSLNGGLMVN